MSDHGLGSEHSISVVRNDSNLDKKYVYMKTISSDPYRIGVQKSGLMDFYSTRSSRLNKQVVTDLVDVTASYPSLSPALPSNVQISLTVIYIVMFSLMFIVIYLQLWMIWYYRHKRLSHQTLFLFMCLVWAGLRTSLFSFYFQNCDQANNLNIPLYWLLYCFPVCLQFSMLCLLLHFFAQVVFKAKAKYEPRQYKRPLRLFLGGSVLAFYAVNVTCAVITKYDENVLNSVPFNMVYIRVTLTESMFFFYGVLLSISIYKMTKMASSERVLEAKGTTVCKALVASILISLLFLSRTIYNIISISPGMKWAPSFGFDWINVTDQADVVHKLSESLAYVSFGVVLFVWEVMPISIVVIFFRVKRLNASQVLTDFSTQSNGSRRFFFDNPRRYDSEDDLASPTSSSHLDAGGSRSFASDSYRTATPRGTPVNSSQWGITTSSSPSHFNSGSINSSPLS